MINCSVYKGNKLRKGNIVAKKKSKFDETFSEVIGFYPEGLYLSKNLFTKEEALKMFREYDECNSYVKDSDIKEAFVRFQATPRELREDGLEDMAWMTCKPDDRGAQPCWGNKDA